MRAMAGVAATLVLLTTSGAFAQPKPAPKPPAKPAAPAGPKTLAQTLTGDAKADYDAGRSLFEDADYAAAAVKFQSAFDKSNDPRLLWNVAGCERNDHHYARALKLVQQYLDSGGALLTDQDRADAKELLDAIAQFTIQLTIVVNEPGADVSIDDVALGKSPLAKPETVDIGLRKIVVKKTGFKEFTLAQRYDGKAATVDVKLDPEVHVGELRVTTAPDAHVFIDGKEVGVGSFKGSVPSGGHTLRVTAPGMQSYQSEVVVTDDEKRLIDVPLTAEVDLTKVVITKREPVYRGFYGKISNGIWFGSGAGYTPPAGYSATGTLNGFVMKLALG
ncbi:MAG TPA: PEGA domain-containing protein, partial [Polyangiaceae bacterium]